MKKNSKPKNQNNDAMKPLNDELGFIDLEPPKIYREGQTRSTPSRQQLPLSKPSKKRKKASPQRKSAQKTEQGGNVKKKRRLKKKFRIAFTAIGLVLLIAIVITILSFINRFIKLIRIL